MQKISLETALEKLTDIVENSLFHYNDYAYKFELVRLTPQEVSDLIIKMNASTENVLSVIMNQKRWFSVRENFKVYIEKQDWVFRWTAVKNNFPILCFDVKDRNLPMYDNSIVERYLLINWGGKEFIGLKTKVNYQPH